MSLQGLMQKKSLLISGLLTHAATYHGDVEIVSHLYGGEERRSNWRTVAKNFGISNSEIELTKRAFRMAERDNDLFQN